METKTKSKKPPKTLNKPKTKKAKNQESENFYQKIVEREFDSMMRNRPR